MAMNVKINFQNNRIFWYVCLFLFVGIVLSFLPLQDYFNLEIRSVFLAKVLSGVPFVFLFILLTIIWLRILRLNNRLSGPSILLFPFLLLPNLAVIVACLSFPPLFWQDDRIFRNGTDYLIMQSFEYGDFADHINYRLIKTDSPSTAVRQRQILWTNNTEDDSPLAAKFNIDSVYFENRYWKRAQSNNLYP